MEVDIWKLGHTIEMHENHIKELKETKKKQETAIEELGQKNKEQHSLLKGRISTLEKERKRNHSSLEKMTYDLTVFEGKYEEITTRYQMVNSRNETLETELQHCRKNYVAKSVKET